MDTRVRDQVGPLIAPSSLHFELRRTTEDKVFPSVLAPNLPNFSVGSLQVGARTSGGISGDSYDLFPLKDGQWGIVIADASGTGVQAARRVVKAQDLARRVLSATAHPAQTLAAVNAGLTHYMAPQHFVTLCCGVLDPNARQIKVSSAGHPPPLWFHAEVELVREICPRPDLMAGIFRDQEYSMEKHYLYPGDVLVFYTDGLIEARSGMELWGVPRLRCAFAACATLPAPDIAHALYQSACDFVGDCPEDDVSIVVLKVT